MQNELAVNYCQLAVVSTDPPEVTAAFRMGLGATFTFLSDHERRIINELDIVAALAEELREEARDRRLLGLEARDADQRAGEVDQRALVDLRQDPARHLIDHVFGGGAYS